MTVVHLAGVAVNYNLEKNSWRSFKIIFIKTIGFILSDNTNLFVWHRIICFSKVCSTQILYECIVNIYCSNVSNKVILGLFILGSELRRLNYIKYFSATQIISFRVFYCWFIGISCSEHISFNARLLTEHKVVVG